MKIVITGGSGFIGTALIQGLKGHKLIILKHGEVWEPVEADAVINLAGENIAGRWTPTKKKAIFDSRIQTTLKLKETVRGAKVWINASAIGYYADGAQGDESLPAGEGFLSQVCQAWEEMCLNVPARVVRARIGVVLSRRGGVLKKMWIPFNMGLGGVIGSGKQMMSWISLEDVVQGLIYCLENSIEGVVNLTAPSPVSNHHFTKTLGKVLRRPTIFPLPAFIAKLIFGEMAEETMLASHEIYPEKLLANGYTFTHDNLEAALK